MQHRYQSIHPTSAYLHVRRLHTAMKFHSEVADAIFNRTDNADVSKQR